MIKWSCSIDRARSAGGLRRSGLVIARRRLDGPESAHHLLMADVRIRRQIAFLAAQMMYSRSESEYFTAKRKAAKSLGIEYRFRPGDLPSNAEIRDQIQAMARMHEGPKRLDHLRDMRFEALRLMRKLARYRPRLIGSVWTGHVRAGSDIDIHIFSDSLALVTDTLEEHGLPYDVQRKRVIKHGEERTFTHIHVIEKSKSKNNKFKVGTKFSTLKWI